MSNNSPNMQKHEIQNICESLTISLDAYVHLQDAYAYLRLQDIYAYKRLQDVYAYVRL